VYIYIYIANNYFVISYRGILGHALTECAMGHAITSSFFCKGPHIMFVMENNYILFGLES